MPSLLDQLQELPDSWGLVVCDGSKRPYQRDWQSNPLTKAQAADEIRAGRAKAIGVTNCSPPCVNTQVTSPPPLRIRRTSSHDL